MTIVLGTGLVLAVLRKYLTAPLRLFARHVEELPRKKGDDKLLRIDAGGDIGALVASFNKMVLELDNQKQALQESEELYRTLVDFTSDFIFWRSADLKTMLYVSPRCTQLTGYDDVEFYQRPELLDEIVYQADRDAWLKHVAVACTGSCAEPLELRFVTKNGEIRWVNHFCRPVFSDTGPMGSAAASRNQRSQKSRRSPTAAAASAANPDRRHSGAGLL